MTSGDTRTRLIEAAEHHFRRFGYRRSTVDDMTRVAELGKGSFYLHFPSKEAAYLEVIEASLERFVAKAERALRAPGPVPDRLRALVEVTARHYSEDELLRASLLGDRSLVDGRVAERAAALQRARIRALLADALEQGHRDGSIRRSVDPQAAAAVLFEAGWAVVRAELEGHADLPLHRALATLNDIVGRGLVERPPGRGESPR
jgi:AcrR family transcriptional regulator